MEKPYRATGKSARLDGAMSSADGTLRAVFDAVAAEIDEAGPGALLEGARMPVWLRPDQLNELMAQIQAMLEKFPSVDEYLSARAPAGADPYALLVVLHKRAATT